MATPRVTRARSKTPLPAIGAKQSHAYGAQGKTDLKAQVRQSGTEFSQGFQSARQDSTAPPLSVAAERNDDNDDNDNDNEEAAPSPRKRGGRSTGLRRPMSKSTALEESEDESVRPPAPRRRQIPDRSGTVMDRGADYRAGDRDGDVENFRPSSFRVFARALPRYIPELIRSANNEFKDILALIFFAGSGVVTFLLCLAFVPLPSTVASVRNEICRDIKIAFGISPYDLPPTEVEATWFRYKHDHIFSKALPDHNMPDLQWAININFLDRIEKVETRMTSMEDKMSSLEDTMTNVQAMLPSRLVVRVVDGRYEIPEAFWDAIQERLAENDDMAPLWQSYMSRNEHEIERFTRQLVSLSVDQAMEDKQVISREAFTETLKEYSDSLTNQYRNDLQEWQGSLQEWQGDILHSAKEIAARAADGAVRNSPAGTILSNHLQDITNLNQLRNNYEALRSINWFSVALGARVDPRLTSPTQKPPSKSWLEVLYRKISPLVLSPNPPIAALQRWEELKDCWCAAYSEAQQSQIAIIIGAKIYPDELIVEHIPAAGTMDIKAAPQDIEIWVEAGSASEAKKITQLIEKYKPHYFLKPCATPPTPKYVCIGAGRYDIHHYDYVQKIPTFKYAEYMALGANKFIIRVTQNWGGDWTCFYRLRMTGDRVSQG